VPDGESSISDRVGGDVRWGQRLRRIVVLVLGIAISLALASTADRMLSREARTQSALAEQSLIAGLRAHIDRELGLLTALRGLFTSSELVTATEFAKFSQLDDHIVVQSPWIRTAWVERTDGTAVAPTPDAIGEIMRGHYRVRFVAPADLAAELDSFDLTADPASVLAMRQAVATRSLAVSDPIRAPQLMDGAVSVLAFEPVFKDDPAAGRYPQLAGFVVGAYQIDGLIGSHLDNSLPLGGVNIAITDHGSTIFVHGEGAPRIESLPLQVGNRAWHIQIATDDGGLQASGWVPGLVLLFGLALTILLHLHLMRIDGEYGRITAKVHAATVELADANRSLAERSAALQSLADDLRRTSKEAQLANSAKTMFLANMSHELRTPLNAMIGFSEIISRQLFGGDAARYTDYARDIHASGMHLLSIIEDLLDMSRIELGQLTLKMAPAKPVALLADVVRLLRHRAHEQGVKIRHDGLDELPELQVDARAMRQALINLLSNAIKFSRSGTVVTIAGRRDRNGDTLLSIIDEGIGIEEANLERIFDPFWQSDAMLQQARGAGLGLAITRRLIEAHGGTIKAESKLGVGTTIVVRLPARLAIDAAVVTRRLA
jgi:signal transduction histidine kinase